MPKRSTASSSSSSVVPSLVKPISKSPHKRGVAKEIVIPASTRRPYPNLPESLREKCFAFKETSMLDKNGKPNPMYLFKNGGYRVELCGSDLHAGRNMAPIDLPDGRTGIIVPFCGTCAAANTRITQAGFYGPVLKTLVDTEKFLVEQLTSHDDPGVVEEPSDVVVPVEEEEEEDASMIKKSKPEPLLIDLTTSSGDEEDGEKKTDE